jgi:cation:H+ antiporter
VLRREAPLMLAAMALFAVFAHTGLSLVTGAGLAAAAIVTLILLVRLARTTADSVLAPEVADFVDDRPGNGHAGTSPGHRLAVEIPRTVAGLVGVLSGAQLLVAAATRMAVALGVPSVIIGFTLVAVGTSLPELVTGIQAQRRGQTDLPVGNLVGSNLFNSLAGGAVVGLATGRHPIRTGWPLLAAMLLIGLLAWALLFRGHRLTRLEALLLAAYAATLPLLP